MTISVYNDDRIERYIIDRSVYRDNDYFIDIIGWLFNIGYNMLVRERENIDR